ncbi:hypothetical protein ONA92_05120 [Mycobacteroides salmoniphilum]|uniref:hypothetical protein n=1 Tax=Mycobacteroides salmoniphilum TaxID=404941 RepID=UPI003565272B
MTALVESPATQDSVSSDWAQPVPELFDPLGLTATLGGAVAVPARGGRGIHHAGHASGDW